MLIIYIWGLKCLSVVLLNGTNIYFVDLMTWLAEEQGHMTASAYGPAKRMAQYKKLMFIYITIKYIF